MTLPHRHCPSCGRSFRSRRRSARFCSLECSAKGQRRPNRGGAPLKERVRQGIQIDDATGCWLWLKALNNQGYGQIRVGDRTELAHRVAYVAFIGPIPADRELDHKCRMPRCVNPDHLEPVTHAQNIVRGIGPSGARARLYAQTHCKRGHPLSGENIYRSQLRFGRRICRACRQLAWQRRKAKRTKGAA